MFRRPTMSTPLAIYADRERRANNAALYIISCWKVSILPSIYIYVIPVLYLSYDAFTNNTVFTP